jgi:hypothetical protein
MQNFYSNNWKKVNFLPRSTPRLYPSIPDYLDSLEDMTRNNRNKAKLKGGVRRICSRKCVGAHSQRCSMYKETKSTLRKRFQIYSWLYWACSLRHASNVKRECRTQIKTPVKPAPQNRTGQNTTSNSRMRKAYAIAPYVWIVTRRTKLHSIRAHKRLLTSLLLHTQRAQ